MEAIIKRKQDVFVAAAEKTPEAVRPYLVKAAPVLAVVSALVDISIPYLIKAWEMCAKVYKILEPYHPEDMACVGVGLFMVFFGGEFPAIITAVEAYRQIGFEPTLKALKVLWEDAKKVQAASEKDDKVDADADGVSDVDQISASKLVERKTLLFLRTTHPESVAEAITVISSGWLAVLASLKISFARAVTLGASIGDILRKPAVHFVGPFAKKVVPEDYHRWIVPVITYICKVIAITIAWTIQTVISAFHSAIRGGHLAASGVVKYLHKWGYIKTSADDTMVDEVIGYALAAMGFLAQLGAGFRLPFPLNILFLPLTVTETLVVWSIME